MSREYRDVYYTSNDGLKLYARDYFVDGSSEGEQAVKTVMCLHGFTRNSADFSFLCDQLPESYRIIVPDQRGRGLSEYDSNTQNYNPAIYVQDMFVLLKELNISAVDIIGTSMGGVIGMTMAAMNPVMVKGLVLNDVGPAINPDGLQRVIDYLGNKPTLNTWADAVAYAKEVNGPAYPKYTDEQWQKFSKNIFVENDDGSVRSAYDSGVSDPHKGFNAHEANLDAWPVFAATVSTQYFVIRGELSDILDAATVEKMVQHDNVLGAIEVKDIGHAPMLDEPEVVHAVQNFLARN